jgi:hypothetical protein
MSLSRRQQHQLHRIETGLLRSDPQFTAMLGIFGRLSAGEALSAWEQVPSRQHSIRQAAALTVKAIAVVAEAIVLVLRAVHALSIAAGTRHGRRLPAPGPERTRRGRGADRSPDPGRPELTADEHPHRPRGRAHHRQVHRRAGRRQHRDLHHYHHHVPDHAVAAPRPRAQRTGPPLTTTHRDRASASPQIRYNPGPVPAAELLLCVADAGITHLIGHLTSTAV